MKTEKELWAVIDTETDEVCWTFGGSSTSPKLMVYASEKKATMGLRALTRTYSLNLNNKKLEVKRIYSV